MIIAAFIYETMQKKVSTVWKVDLPRESIDEFSWWWNAVKSVSDANFSSRDTKEILLEEYGESKAELLIDKLSDLSTDLFTAYDQFVAMLVKYGIKCTLNDEADIKYDVLVIQGV